MVVQPTPIRPYPTRQGLANLSPIAHTASPRVLHQYFPGHGASALMSAVATTAHPVRPPSGAASPMWGHAVLNADGSHAVAIAPFSQDSTRMMVSAQCSGPLPTPHVTTIISSHSTGRCLYVSQTNVVYSFHIVRVCSKMIHAACGTPGLCTSQNLRS
jgi:hypothetical protein